MSIYCIALKESRRVTATLTYHRLPRPGIDKSVPRFPRRPWDQHLLPSGMDLKYHSKVGCDGFCFLQSLASSRYLVVHYLLDRLRQLRSINHFSHSGLNKWAVSGRDYSFYLKGVLAVKRKRYQNHSRSFEIWESVFTIYMNWWYRKLRQRVKELILIKIIKPYKEIRPNGLRKSPASVRPRKPKNSDPLH